MAKMFGLGALIGLAMGAVAGTAQAAPVYSFEADAAVAGSIS